MKTNKSKFSARAFVSAMIVGVVGLAMCFAVAIFRPFTPSTVPPSTPPVYETTPSVPPATFNATTTRSEMATKLLGAFATVKIMNTATNTRAGFGSGIAVADNGYLVTNYHVVSKVMEYPTKYSVQLEMKVDGELKTDVQAEVLWTSPTLDMAILKSYTAFETYANMANRSIQSTNSMKFCEEVWTLGTPVKINLWGTYSDGNITSPDGVEVGKTRVDPITYVHNYLIQHNADISSGNSGGPLFDKFGNLIGLNTCGEPSTSTTTATNLFFAVPIYPIMVVLDKVIDAYNQGGLYTTPVLGINGYDKDYWVVNSELGFDRDGMYVSTVTENSPAAKAGLPSECVLTGIADKGATALTDAGVHTIYRVYDLTYALLHYKTGDTITVFYQLDGQNGRVELEI